MKGAEDTSIRRDGSSDMFRSGDEKSTTALTALEPSKLCWFPLAAMSPVSSSISKGDVESESTSSVGQRSCKTISGLNVNQGCFDKSQVLKGVS